MFNIKLSILKINYQNHSTLRHHICELCYLLLSQENKHEAAFCTMFKTLDEEYKDFPAQPTIEITLDVVENTPPIEKQKPLNAEESLAQLQKDSNRDPNLESIKELQQDSNPYQNQRLRSQSDPIVLFGTERPWFTSNWAIASAIVDGEL